MQCAVIIWKVFFVMIGQYDQTFAMLKDTVTFYLGRSNQCLNNYKNDILTMNHLRIFFPFKKEYFMLKMYLT